MTTGTLMRPIWLLPVSSRHALRLGLLPRRTFSVSQQLYAGHENPLVGRHFIPPSHQLRVARFLYQLLRFLRVN